eukprot:TRINITY_DN52678_c0_g1_i1.p1 TRINITY_DN52678_c0_g1~~TRINITY_DN52678_c0_g1_i1.p1  ORF type:complete len:192 (-),score=59.26 TRINITY_DN52678_c0_g1_i1:68-643(-)
MKHRIVIILFVFCLAKADKIGDVFDAVRKDDVGKMKSILENNRDDLETFINIRDKNSGQTPLMMSVLMGKVEIVRVLLAEDVVDVTIPEKDGYTPFHGAGFQGRAEIAKILLEDSRNIDPNLKHKDGFTPMHRACWGQEKRHTDTVAMFIKVGNVPWDQKTSQGKTCMDITQNSGTKKWLKKWSKRSKEDL